MAAFKSTQETNRAASPMKPNLPKDTGGEIHIRRFEYLDAANAKAAGDTIDLVTMLTGEKMLFGHVAWEAGGGGAQMQIGTVADADRYLAAATDVSAAGSSFMADKHALFYGEEHAAETLIRATIQNAAFAANKKIHGFVAYTKN